MPFVPSPRTSESAPELADLRRREHDERPRERLYTLWLVASETVKNRRALARQPGRDREKVCRRLKDYTKGGLAAHLQAAQRPGPPGPPSCLRSRLSMRTSHRVALQSAILHGCIDAGRRSRRQDKI